MADVLRQRIWRDATYGTASSDGRLVFTIEDLALKLRQPRVRQVILPRGNRHSSRDQSPSNRLAAHEIRTGKLKWHNSTSGCLDRFSRRGVAVQGDLLLHAGKLYLAGGNAASPGVFDLASGQCLTPPPRGMGSRALRGRELILSGDRVLVRGQPLYSIPSAPVYDRSVRWPNSTVVAANAKLSCLETNGDRGPTWRLVARGLDEGESLWEQPLPAEPVRWGLAVDARGRVVVALRDGRVLCLGPKGRPGQ